MSNFGKGGLSTLKEIAEATGIHRVTLSKIANNKRYNVASTPSKSSAHTFDCGVGDILEYVPDSA